MTEKELKTIDEQLASYQARLAQTKTMATMLEGAIQAMTNLKQALTEPDPAPVVEEEPAV
jgi:chromosome condensin MukBEF ATPase and DNA-binding subunit MukB